MSSSQRALSAYRNGLRASRIAFNKDTRMLLAARSQIREGMSNPNSELSKDEQIVQLNDISQFLRKNVVQGQNVGKGEDGRDVFKLNIHNETELGDNKSIKYTKATLKATGGGCCGGSD